MWNSKLIYVDFSHKKFTKVIIVSIFWSFGFCVFFFYAKFGNCRVVLFRLLDMHLSSKTFFLSNVFMNNCYSSSLRYVIRDLSQGFKIDFL